MRQKALLSVVVMLLITPAAAGAPEGFRLSKPLTDRAVKIGGNKRVVVNCAKSHALWRATADRPETADAAARANVKTGEIQLRPDICAPLERWLKGRPIDLTRLADVMFTFAHELGHAAPGIRDELKADCWATWKFNRVARAFGVKRAATLRRLRNDAPLVPPAAELC